MRFSLRLDNFALSGYSCTDTQMSKRTTTSSKRARCCPGIESLFEARFFKALCDPCRIGILLRLAKAGGWQTVGQVATCCPTDLSVVSRHLAILRDAGVVEADKHGKNVYYRVRYRNLAATLRAMADGVASCCPRPRGKVKGK